MLINIFAYLVPDCADTGGYCNGKKIFEVFYVFPLCGLAGVRQYQILNAVA